VPGAGEYWEAIRAQQAAKAERMRAVQASGPARETPPTWGGPTPEPTRVPWSQVPDGVDPVGHLERISDHKARVSNERDGGIAREIRRRYPTPRPRPTLLEGLHTTEATRLVNPSRPLVTSGRVHKSELSSPGILPTLPKVDASTMQERVADLLAVEARTKTEVKQAKRREQNRIAARISRARKKSKP
jgi:hypothetical protein